MKAHVYGAPGCRYCGAAKRLLESKGIEYTYSDITEGSNKEDLESKIGITVSSVPQIIINDDYIGGFKELQEFLQT